MEETNKDPDVARLTALMEKLVERNEREELRRFDTVLQPVPREEMVEAIVNILRDREASNKIVTLRERLATMHKQYEKSEERLEQVEETNREFQTKVIAELERHNSLLERIARRLEI